MANNVTSIGVENKPILPSAKEVGPVELAQLNRKTAEKGMYALFDGTNNDAGMISNLSDKLNKIALVIPPNSKITLTLTMMDSSTRKISFENIDPETQMTARLYFNNLAGRFAVAEKDVDKPAKSAPLDPGFFTRRKVSILDEKEDDIAFRGNPENGLERVVTAANTPKTSPAGIDPNLIKDPFPELDEPEPKPEPAAI